MNSEILYRDEDFYLVQKTEFTDEIIDLFDSTQWGEKGALYEHKDTRTRLSQIRNPVQIELRSSREDELAGTCVFVNRLISVRDKEFDFCFVRYLVGSPKFRGKGILSKYGAICMESVSTNSNRPTVYIGIVEEFNSKSQNLVTAAGYSKIAQVRTLSFSRLFPKKSKFAKRISGEDEKQEIRTLLRAHYFNHSLYHQENIFLKDDYYYIKKNDEIIAGVQAYHALWVVRKLPGSLGKFIYHTIPYIPVLNKVFNPRRFEFLAFDGIYYKEGHLKDLHLLFEHVLASFKLKTALFWLDERSKNCKQILEGGNLGILHKSGVAANSVIMMRFENVSDDDKQLFYDLPVYQSGFDFI